MTETKKKKRKVVFIVLGIILFIVAFCFYLKWELPIQRTYYKSFEEYEKSGAFAFVEIPEEATDIRYYYDNMIIGEHTVYSFVIEDDEAYDILMESIKDKVCTEWGGTHPEWSNEWMPFSTYPYTEEEREEMIYLEENFMNMDYKEILSMSRHKYGFSSGYGASVADYIEFENQLDRFPTYECFNEVMDDNLEDYTILEYAPQNVGASTHGIILNEETRRFVVFYFGYIK